MAPTLSPQEFVAKWHASARRERANSQEHFIDLCHLVGHPTPAEMDPKGTRFAFEVGVGKDAGRHGYSDVWYSGHFGWEYKGEHGNLDKAYQQLLQYKEALLNPPLLIVSDMDHIVIHPNFNNNVNSAVTLELTELLEPRNLEKLKAIFFEPEAFRSPKTKRQVTEEAAAQFADLSQRMRNYGEDPTRAAHFLIRILFCLFAEDIGLLPERVFTKLVKATWMRPQVFAERLQQLFSVMCTGGAYGPLDILRFNGGLFDQPETLTLDSEGMEILSRVCELDWSSIQPSILGTLFRRSLDPAERARLGAQYTSEEDILTVIDPVLMAPLREEWSGLQTRATDLARLRDSLSGKKHHAAHQSLTQLLTGFATRLANTTVLDPACGSGNFLHLALKELLDLWKQVSIFGSDLGLPLLMPDVNPCPSPAQMHGIEVNTYARELASTSVWIGFIQWRRENGFRDPPEPILKLLHTIQHMDAILARNPEGQPIDPKWPSVDVIVGNPPFLGGKRMRSELGDTVVNDLFSVYADRVPREADLVCYWFEKARAMIEEGRAGRAGLLATQGIRGGANRRVLERIKASGDIFMAWSDRPWVLDGAAVRVSMVGFDNGSRLPRTLNGAPVSRINSNLTATSDITRAKPLRENQGIAYMGDTKAGHFELDDVMARQMLAVRHNPNGRPNRDVIRPWVNGLDIARRPRYMWIIDFGLDMPIEEAAQYERPFEYVKKAVKPQRARTRRESYVAKWWLHGEARHGMRSALVNLARYVATANLAKHRLFVWFSTDVLPDHQLIVFARDDDHFLGVLQSRLHQLWALSQGTALTDRPRYTPTTTFETFPFPWPPGHEPKRDVRFRRIALAACELVRQRDAWLNVSDLPERERSKRTLTNLYNERPTWLDLAHRRLDEAVLDAYGWSHELSDEDVLNHLLELNLKRYNDGGEHHSS